jgi:phage repressor protein C with HTH and peptisase S24 domain
VRRNQGPRRWPVRLFRVVDDSMRPTLAPGDGLLAVRGGRVRRGQLRVFRDPRLSSRWMVKRVADVYGSGRGAVFEARSDNPRAPGAADSHEFGWVSAAESYRVLWTHAENR